MSHRPELSNPPELFYNELEAKKYHQSSRMINIQAEISNRAIELLSLPEGPSLILDIGCGTGLSGQALEEAGHVWIGCDISKDMLSVGRERDDVSGGDTFNLDMGTGLPIRSGVFDGAISISAIQWLCYSNNKLHEPRKRLLVFFQSLYNSLKRGGKAALQFYPENEDQVALITEAAMRCGFSGGVLVDFPNSTKAKKYYLVIVAGQDLKVKMPTPLGLDDKSGAESSSLFTQRSMKKNNKSKKEHVKSKSWILNKKESQRKQGKEVRPDSKYTGRKRPSKF